MRNAIGRQIENPADIERFMFGGNATFTLVSKRTGTRYTYKMFGSEKTKDLYFASVMYGPDNTRDFTYMGAVSDRATLRETAKSKVTAGDVRFRVLSGMLKHVAAKTPGLADHVEFWHEGRCACCGRKLTVPSSIESGIGPECAKRLTA